MKEISPDLDDVETYEKPPRNSIDIPIDLTQSTEAKEEVTEEKTEEKKTEEKTEEKKTEETSEPTALVESQEEIDEEAAYRERRQKRNERLKKRRRRRRIKQIVMVICLAVLAMTGGAFAYMKSTGTVDMDLSRIVALIKNVNSEKEEVQRPDQNSEEAIPTDTRNIYDSEETETSEEAVEATEIEETVEVVEPEETEEEKIILEQAQFAAAQYDYIGALNILKEAPMYKTSTELQEYAKEMVEARKNCVIWKPEQVTHVFFHSLIVDPSKAFDGDYKEAGYNQVMTTLDEFNKIIQSMYDRGYVMVSLYDMAEVQEDGTIVKKQIHLPEGKIPFVLSQDDVSYYHCYTGDGIASRLIVDEEGKVRNEYIQDDGTVSVGDYDMVPLIDRFVEAHPDFSYLGSKGIIALTGYNGVLGYRTDSSYETRPDSLDHDKVEWLDAHPEFSLEKERAEAKKVADAMKENGWYFASHTWGHKNVGTASMERLMTDTKLFKENVEPVIGTTDIIIFAFGADMAGGEEYAGEKFEYFKSQGYHYYCNVDSSKYYVQITDRYLRQGRRNLDGYRMYYNPEMVEDLFDAAAVFDSSRPTPVPPM